MMNIYEEKYHQFLDMTIVTVPKYNRKYIEIEAIYIYMSNQYFWPRRGSSTKNGGYKKLVSHVQSFHPPLLVKSYDHASVFKL
jgi:hypothetical protein